MMYNLVLVLFSLLISYNDTTAAIMLPLDYGNYWEFAEFTPMCTETIIIENPDLPGDSISVAKPCDTVRYCIDDTFHWAGMILYHFPEMPEPPCRDIIVSYDKNNNLLLLKEPCTLSLLNIKQEPFVIWFEFQNYIQTLYSSNAPDWMGPYSFHCNIEYDHRAYSYIHRIYRDAFLPFLQLMIPCNGIQLVILQEQGGFPDDLFAFSLCQDIGFTSTYHYNPHTMQYYDAKILIRANINGQILENENFNKVLVEISKSTWLDLKKGK